jgi:hypothetical protein
LKFQQLVNFEAKLRAEISQKYIFEALLRGFSLASKNRLKDRFPGSKSKQVTGQEFSGHHVLFKKTVLGPV